MISIIVPAYNEENLIPNSVRSLKEMLEKIGVENGEILVIDDGSSDETGPQAKKSGAVVIRHPYNVGYGRALKTGIAAASNDTIIIIDADLTYPVEAIPELLAKFKEEGVDMVVGARSGKYYDESKKKKILRKILKFLVEFTAGRKIPDINSGLRVFSKKTVAAHTPYLCDTFSFTTSLTLAYIMTGYFVEYIKIDYLDRHGKTKVRLFRDSLRTFQYIVQAATYYNPLKIFILLSFICILLSVGGFLLAMITHLNAPYYLGIGCFLLSILVFCLGLHADLLRRIMVK